MLVVEIGPLVHGSDRMSGSACRPREQAVPAYHPQTGAQHVQVPQLSNSVPRNKLRAAAQAAVAVQVCPAELGLQQFADYQSIPSLSARPSRPD